MRLTMPEMTNELKHALEDREQMLRQKHLWADVTINEHGIVYLQWGKLNSTTGKPEVTLQTIKYVREKDGMVSRVYFTHC